MSAASDEYAAWQALGERCDRLETWLDERGQELTEEEYERRFALCVEKRRAWAEAGDALPELVLI